WPKAQSPPRLEPAYRTRTSRITISFKRKAREAIPFFLLDIASRRELILSRFHAAIAWQLKPYNQGHVFQPFQPQDSSRGLAHSRAAKGPASDSSRALRKNRSRSVGSLANGAGRIQSRARHALQDPAGF